MQVRSKVSGAAMILLAALALPALADDPIKLTREEAIKAATSYPFALVVDSAGNIYISDSFNQAVRVLRPPAQ